MKNRGVGYGGVCVTTGNFAVRRIVSTRGSWAMDKLVARKALG